VNAGAGVAFVVRGLPGPQGSKKFVGLSKAGRGLMIEASRKVKPWRQAVAAAAREAMQGLAVMDGPLRLEVHFTLPAPKSRPKSRLWPDRKPDLSKLIRSTEDALTGIAWADDARVVEIVATKRYAGVNGAPEYVGCVVIVSTIQDKK